MAVKVAVPSVSEAVELAIEICGSSSSVMTRSAVAVSPTIVALVALDNVTVAVSSTSSVLSRIIGTVIVPELSPAEMVTVPVKPV